MRKFLEMIIIAIALLTLVDLLDAKESRNYYYVSNEKENVNLSQFSKDLDYVLKINKHISNTDIVDIIDSTETYYKRTKLTKKDFLSICAWESRLKKNMVGRIDKNDKGICQINYFTWRYFRKKNYIEGEWKDIFNIEYNMHVASVILMKHREQLKKIFPKFDKKDIDLLLILSYNKGVNGVRKIVKKNMHYIINVRRMK